MIDWIPFSLVSLVSLLRAVGLVKSSAETVSRSCSWMSVIVRALMNTVSERLEISGSVQEMMLGGTDP